MDARGFDIFNLIFGSFFLFGILWIWLITLLVVSYVVWSNVRGKHATGTVVGFTKKQPSDRVYFPVVEFLSSDGRVRRAISDTGSFPINLSLIGKQVSISYVSDAGKVQVHLTGSAGQYIFAVALFAFSTAFFEMANQALHFRLVNLALALSVMALALIRSPALRAILIRIKERHLQAASVPPSEAPIVIVPPEDIQRAMETAKAERLTQLNSQGRGSLAQAPYRLLAFFGLVPLGISFYLGYGQHQLETVGIRTQGRIVDYHRNHSSKGADTFSAIVEFPLNGGTTQFQDRVGESHPVDINSAVTVLYDPSSPGHAMIDRGVRNWILPIVLCLIGCAFLWLSQRARAARMKLAEESLKAA